MTFDFTTLSESERDSMARAGDRILECYRVLRKSQANIVGELLKGQGEFFEWDHYPSGDVYDHETHSQYYYHAHPPEDRSLKWGNEHGHFHTFLRPLGMPAGIRAARLPDYEKLTGENDELSHLIAISMDPSGLPIRLFTTNRWVTGETWYDAESVCKMLDHFDIDLAWPSWPVNIWATNMIKLFRPQIKQLLHQRDVRIAELASQYPVENIYENRNFDVTSILDISVEDQVRNLRLPL